MSCGNAWVGLGVGAVLLGSACGPTIGVLDDVYPRNCGVEGPVALFDVAASTYVEVRRAGEHYLIWSSPDAVTFETWAVDRCGEQQTRLHVGPGDSSLVFGVAGDHVLSCDQSTGAIAYVDPAGIEPPRALFGAVEKCRVVPLGQGLAAQEQGSGTVWFHPDPADPQQQARVVTDAARVADPDWIYCNTLELACTSSHPHGIDIRAAGDELLVALESKELLAFSSTSLTSRILDPGPLQAMDVLPGAERVVVDRHLGPTLIVERETGASFELCCYDDLSPIQQLGDWLVKGHYGAPYAPEPPAWTNFRAVHLTSGHSTEIEGRETWRPRARVTADTILVDIGPYSSTERERYVVWPATGERELVSFPGDEVWAVPGQDGVYAANLVGDDTVVLRHLAGPGQEPRVLLEGMRITFATRDGRIVFERAREPGEPSSLSVMLPDHRVVELEPESMAFGVFFYGQKWPIARDEVLYLVEDGGRWVLKRTVLP